ncbi:predicted protein [Histoplasma capsulatum var. duboisii H88]|uniref:Predicted protein n=2 Tax=Ajellomyces capsulatus TaxID=5037 RepID=F0U4T5_AJEC8|nr:predicted protein [Histoplasma capsulatum H143]EGC41189.1 predicted protein [Histoplasma capsulatum var. duboisii H88]
MNNAGGVISALYRCLPTAFTVGIMSSSKDRAPSDTATLTGTGENSSGTQGTGIRRQLGRKGLYFLARLRGPTELTGINNNAPSAAGLTLNSRYALRSCELYHISAVPKCSSADVQESLFPKILTAAASPIPQNGGRIHVVTAKWLPKEREHMQKRVGRIS